MGGTFGQRPRPLAAEPPARPRPGAPWTVAVRAGLRLAVDWSSGGPNCPVVIPLMHKADEGMRSHCLTIQFSVLDAPAPDEIVVALGVSIGGRPHHPIGDRYQDLADLAGIDV